MLNLMTYNIGGNKEHLSLIEEIVKAEKPDVLVLNEISWIDDKSAVEMSSRIGLPYFCFSKSTKSINHTAIFSTFSLDNRRHITGLQNSGIIVMAKTKYGQISIAGINLAPNTEDTRLSEIKNVCSAQYNCEYKIIMGDLNSISPENQVKSNHLSGTSEFEEPVRYDVIGFIKNLGYRDAAVIACKGHVATVPYTVDGNVEYYDLRLDYVFLSGQLVDSRRVNYSVIASKKTNRLSDHYPIVVRIN